MGRRRLTQALALGTGAIAVGGGLGYWWLHEQSATKEPSPNESLLQAIESLPDTPYRHILQQKVSPIFSSSPPPYIQLDETQIPLIDRSVFDLHTVVGDELSGVVKMHYFEDGTPIPSYPTIGSTTVDLPCPYLLTNEELPQAPRVEEGMWIFGLSFEKGVNVFSGVNPNITINSPPNSAITPSDLDFYKRKRDFIRVKEAASLFYNIQWLTDVDTIMSNRRMSPFIQTVDREGKQTKTEALTAYNLSLIRNNGRFGAMMDIAGSIFALKAYGDIHTLKSMGLDRDYGQDYLDALSGIDLGTTGPEILETTYSLILNNAHGERGIYYNPVFDFNTLP